MMLSELVKLAYTLDKKGEYELANEVQGVMIELIQRVGASPSEVASLANYFDELGETALADKFDKTLKEAKKVSTKPGKGRI